MVNIHKVFTKCVPVVNAQGLKNEIESLLKSYNYQIKVDVYSHGITVTLLTSGKRLHLPLNDDDEISDVVEKVRFLLVELTNELPPARFQRMYGDESILPQRDIKELIVLAIIIVVLPIIIYLLGSFVYQEKRLKDVQTEKERLECDILIYELNTLVK